MQSILSVVPSTWFGILNTTLLLKVTPITTTTTSTKMTDETFEEVKVDKWDGTALKNALDDVIRKIFTDDLKYAEKNLFVDIRLLLSTLGCVVALYALLYDYLHPFPSSKMVLTVCVLTYFLLMSILTLFMTFVEKNIILVCRQREASGIYMQVLIEHK